MIKQEMLGTECLREFVWCDLLPKTKVMQINKLQVEVKIKSR